MHQNRAGALLQDLEKVLNVRALQKLKYEDKAKVRKMWKKLFPVRGIAKERIFRKVI